jgi:hypothetical protein
MAAGVGDPADPASPEVDTARWGIAPVLSETEGERSEFAFTLEPGASVVDSVAITNLSSGELTFDLYGADGIVTDDGDTAVVDRYSPVEDLGAWIGFNQVQVVVPADSALGVPFRVTAPADAIPGEHCGGVVASLHRDPAASGDASNLVVDARTAVWVCVTVPGDVVSALSLSGVTARYAPGRGGFGGGSVTVSGEVANTGNLKLGATAVLDVAAPFGWWGRTGEPVRVAEVLPGQSMPLSITLDGVPPWARLTTEVTLTPTPRDGLPRAPQVWLTRTVWAAPWIAGLALLAVGLAVWWAATARRRRRRRLARAVARELAARGLPVDSD